MWNKKMIRHRLRGFSTVEALVAAVIITVVMMMVYSAISTLTDKRQSVRLLRGISSAEKWNAQNPVANGENETEVAFEGGKTTVNIVPDPESPDLLELEFVITDTEGKKIHSWKEYRISQ